MQKDDNEIIRHTLLNTDMVVFATPLYYYGMSAQLKIVIDRFCAYNNGLMTSTKIIRLFSVIGSVGKLYGGTRELSDNRIISTKNNHLFVMNKRLFFRWGHASIVERVTYSR